MVVLSTQFTLISALCSLAAISIPANVNAAAVPAAPSSKHSRLTMPTIPLPRLAGKKHSGKEKEMAKPGRKSGKKNGKPSKGKHHKERMVEWDPVNPLLKIGEILVRNHDELEVGVVPLIDVQLEQKQDRDQDHVQVYRRHNDDDNNAHVREHDKRDEDSGVPGKVDIMSNSTRLASLFMESDNSTGESKWVLNASDTNQTQLSLVTSPTISSDTSSGKQVMLQKYIFDAPQANMVPYCATFDPSPPSPEPLTLEPCFNNTNASPHKSQAFAYNPDSGVISPMWFNGEDDSMSPSEDDQDVQDPITPSNASVASVTSMDDSDGNGNLSSRDASSPNAQNVTLVFVPSAPQAPHDEALDSQPDSSTFFTTVTMTSSATQTVTTIVTSTTDVAGALDVTTSSTMTLSGTSSSASPSPSAADVGPTWTISSSSTVTSSPSSGALAVEVVGPSPSSVSASLVTSDSAVPSSSSSPAEPSPTSVDAEAVASSIAAASASTTSDSSESPSPTSSSTSTLTTASVDSVEAAPSASMTPVSTAPYEWMFHAEPRL